jgi:hypothetical protein
VTYPLGGSYPWGPADVDYLASRRSQVVHPHPKPEVVSREATPEETPAGAARVAARARGRGFTVEVTYARGTVLTARGKPGVTAESIAVRMRHPDGRRAIAVWLRAGVAAAWKFDLAVVTPLRGVNATALTRFLEGEG